MQTASLYTFTAVIFLTLDAIMLRLHMAPLFQRHIGGMMLENIRMAPAALFYLAYVAGLLYLVSLPALKSGGSVVVPAVVLGFMAYGTYEFTSYAIMKDWSARMVMTDVIWGSLLTGFSAWAGLALTRAIFKV
ncbi:MAG: DUF2177 family protein [Rhodobacteraceae bacterium]|jgi:uncharacterized membrane protein|nr:DUF2177 family protein [Paracoccaceae bacterium]